MERGEVVGKMSIMPDDHVSADPLLRISRIHLHLSGLFGPFGLVLLGPARSSISPGHRFTKACFHGEDSSFHAGKTNRRGIPSVMVPPKIQSIVTHPAVHHARHQESKTACLLYMRGCHTHTVHCTVSSKSGVSGDIYSPGRHRLRTVKSSFAAGFDHSWLTTASFSRASSVTMASYTLKSLALLFLSISPAFSSPILPPGVDAILPRQDAGSCRNQSCEIATIAGSTGATVYPYKTYPMGYTMDGNCCIVRYFPAVKQPIYDAISGQQAYCASHGGDAPKDANPPGVDHVTTTYNPAPAKRAATTCKPKILIFAKGTGEPFDLGITVGPMLQGSLNAAEWDVRGVSYDNSFANDYCLGLPGGVTARGVLAKAVSDCPNSIIAMSGYSQGAMVIRNAIARAPASDVAHVKNVVNFGDPFDGAPIGQYNGPRTIYCMAADGVCGGNFAVSLAHLSYSQDIAAAVKEILLHRAQDIVSISWVQKWKGYNDEERKT
nr:cutinase [Quercus suber]